jgi:hypothetical protein
MFGKARPKGSGRPFQKIQVFDIKNNLTTVYDSIGEAARALSCNESSIRTSLKNPLAKPYKGRYQLSLVP